MKGILNTHLSTLQLTSTTCPHCCVWWGWNTHTPASPSEGPSPASERGSREPHFPTPACGRAGAHTCRPFRTSLCSNPHGKLGNEIPFGRTASSHGQGERRADRDSHPPPAPPASNTHTAQMLPPSDTRSHQRTLGLHARAPTPPGRRRLALGRPRSRTPTPRERPRTPTPPAGFLPPAPSPDVPARAASSRRTISGASSQERGSTTLARAP